MTTPEPNDTTRRRFLGLAIAGGAAATTGARGGARAAEAAPAPATAADVPTGRAHYQIFQPGRIGPMLLKHRLVRSAAAAISLAGSPEASTASASRPAASSSARRCSR